MWLFLSIPKTAITRLRHNLIRTSIDFEDNTLLFRSSVFLPSSIVACLFLGCATNPTGTQPDADFFVREGSSFVLRVGDTAGIQTLNALVLVRFSDVLQDNRCPTTLPCSDEGHATVQVAVQTALTAQEVQVDMPTNGNVDVIVEEVTIEFLRLEPIAQEDVSVPLLDYKLALRVNQTGGIDIPTKS